MNLTALRSSLRVLLPAALLLASCSKKDEPAPTQVPDKAYVLAMHDAVNNSTRAIKVSIGDKEGPSVAYGAYSPYQTVGAGSLTVKTVIDATGGATLYNVTQTLAKDKYYSFFAYSVPGQSTGSVSGLFVEDNLTAPSSGMAKIRLVHVGLDLDSPLALSKTPAGGGALQAITTPVAIGGNSAFVEIPAGTASYNLSNSSNSAIQPAAGGSVLSTPFAAGKIYTIVIRGATAANSPTATENFTLSLITHN